jgi:hypothetical protein
MGMPTSVRDKTGTTYLLKTLASLSENLTPTQREARQILIAVFLVDKSEEKRDMIVKDIEKHHADLLDSGLLQVLEVCCVLPALWPHFGHVTCSFCGHAGMHLRL